MPAGIYRHPTGDLPPSPPFQRADYTARNVSVFVCPLYHTIFREFSFSIPMLNFNCTYFHPCAHGTWCKQFYGACEAVIGAGQVLNLG